MIAINVLICALLLFNDISLTDAAATTNYGNGMSFLRRRTGSNVKRLALSSPEVQPVEAASSDPASKAPRRYIKFELRGRTKSNDEKEKSGPIGKILNGFWQTVLRPFDELEKEFFSSSECQDGIRNEEAIVPELESNANESSQIDGSLDETLHNKDANAASECDCPRYSADLDRLLKSEFDDSESESEYSSSLSTPSAKLSPHSNSPARILSKHSLNLEDIQELARESESFGTEDGFKLDDAEFDAAFIEDTIIDPIIYANYSNKEQASTPVKQEYYVASDFPSYPSNAVGVEITSLSDSDLESWEKIEVTTLDLVKSYVEDPGKGAQIVTLKSNSIFKFNVIRFLSSIFLKLAKKLYYHPPENYITSTLKAANSFDGDDFVKVILNGDDVSTEKKHEFLNSSDVEQILFFDEDDFLVSEWGFLAPANDDLRQAFELYKRNSKTQVDIKQIEQDLPRLPLNYYKYYAERRRRKDVNIGEPEPELLDKIRIIFAFIIYFEGQIVDDASKSPRLLDPGRKFIYSQGFDQIAAYFAINFDLLHAVTITDRFIQVYLRELVNIDQEDMRSVFKAIDARACEIARAFFDANKPKFSLNHGIILDILGLYPFSDKNATLLYFQSATNLVDLDRLVQFLLMKVPRAHAHKSISLLAAANMIFMFMSLDQLFDQELGSEGWSQLKESIDQLDDVNRHEILENLVFDCMGQMFLLFKDKVAHSGKDFDDFLSLAEKLVPLLQTIN